MRSRHCFGNKADVYAAIAKRIIRPFDLLFLENNDAGNNHSFGWVDDQGKVIIAGSSDGLVGIVEYATRADFPAEGESPKMYIDLENSIGYIWNTTTEAYQPIKAEADATSIIPIVKTVVGEIPSTSTATTIVEYIDEIQGYTDAQIDGIFS